MDEARIDYPRTFAGCLAVIVLLGLGVAVGRCSAPAAAQETQPVREGFAFLGNDGTATAQAATADLNAFLHSVTTTTTTPPPRQTPNFDAGDGGRWDQLAQCESGGRWDYPPVTGGFSGGIMFHIGTWRAMGGEEFAPDAYLASREQQIVIAERTQAAAGGSMSPWPGCSRKFGWL